MKKGDAALFTNCMFSGTFRNSRFPPKLSKKELRPLFGFSLLEVILALAILAGALAALGEVLRLGDQNAAAAADESQAEMLAESVMAEILVGARPLTSVSGAVLPFEDDPQWAVSVTVQPTEYVELVAVQVRVAQQLPPEQEPAYCDLVRWVPNPDYLPATAQTTQQSSQQSSSSSSGSSTGSSSTSGTGTGGQQGTGGGQR
jgi:prepilin-type N-terminal cleavage/methylation domain-containing protein